jgi:hypothetical protein
MILGGNESVPHNVVNAIFFLNFRNPEKGKILRKKISTYISEHGEKITESDFDKIPYLGYCSKETLRLSSNITFPLHVYEDTVIKG